MRDYVNTEQMERAANTFDSAVDGLKRLIGQFDDTVHCLTPLIGQGYGNNLEQLIQLLSTQKAITVYPAKAFIKAILHGCNVYTYDVISRSTNEVINGQHTITSKLDAYKYANDRGYVIQE